MNPVNRIVKAVAASVWVLLLGVAVFVAPPSENTGSLVWQLALFEGPDPLLVAVFQMMGIWPLWYGRVLWRDSWPIALLALASFAVGAFALMPALFFRNPERPPRQHPQWLVGFCRSVVVRWILAAISLGLLGWGVLAGDWERAAALWAKDGFVFTYCLDFAALSAVYPFLVWQERRRRAAPATMGLPP